MTEITRDFMVSLREDTLDIAWHPWAQREGVGSGSVWCQVALALRPPSRTALTGLPVKALTPYLTTEPGSKQVPGAGSEAQSVWQSHRLARTVLTGKPVRTLAPHPCLTPKR